MTRAELEEMTKEDLVNYADDHDIEVHHNWLKDDIVSAIIKGEKAAARHAPAAEAKQLSQPATADELADATAALVKWLEEAGHRDHALVVRAKAILDGFK